MSFYSYKNSGSTHCPCSLNGNEVLSGLNEKNPAFRCSASTTAA